MTETKLPGSVNAIRARFQEAIDPQPATLAEALALLQTQLPEIRKTSKAQYGSYANLTDVSRELLPVMGKLGLSFTCRPMMKWRLNEDPELRLQPVFVLAYRLTHASTGEVLEGDYPLPSTPTTTPQQIGSAITYGRRYCLCAVTGAVAEEDDDGQAASTPAPASAGRKRATPERAAGNLPRNTDGSVSRSRSTDAELAATGQMTDQQLRDHNRLERETKGTGPQGTTRLTTTPDDDIWLLPPYEGPDSPQTPVRTPRAASNVAGVIHGEFKRLGFDDKPREARLGVMSTITRRTITTTNDLTAAEALTVKRLISACRDEGVLAAKLLELQQEAPDAS